MKDDFFKVLAWVALAFFILIPLVILVSALILIPTAIIVGIFAFRRLVKRQPFATEVLHDRTAAVFPSPEDFQNKFIDRLLKLDPCPTYNLFETMVRIGVGLYDAENVIVKPMLLHPQGSPEEAQYRQQLIDFERKAQDPDRTIEIFSRVLFTAFIAFANRLPRLATADTLQPDTTLFHVLLDDLIVDKATLIDMLRLPPFDQVAFELSIFVDLRKQLKLNEREASAGSKTVIEPKDYRKDDIVPAYLGGTSFVELFEQPIPWELPEETRFSGHWIVAPQGKGKTTLLTSMLKSDFERDASIIIFDGKGDLIDEVGSLQFLEDRYLILDPRRTGINPLVVEQSNTPQAAERLEYVFSALLEARITPLQSVLFRNVFRALVTAFPNPTLATFQDLLLNGWEPYREYINVLRGDLKDFFLKQYDRDAYKLRRAEVLTRLDLLLSNDHIRNMMLLPTRRFSIAEAMDAGKVIIINNSIANLGEQGAEFLGRYFLSEIWAAAIARTGVAKPCYVYIDEAHRVIHRDEKVGQIIDECRSKKIALIMAHQRIDQITLPSVLTALGNCAIRYANSDEEARILAPRMRTSVDYLQSLSVGQFAAFVRDLTPKAVTIHVTPADFKNLPKIARKPTQAPAATTVPIEVSEESDSWDKL